MRIPPVPAALVAGLLLPTLSLFLIPAAPLIGLLLLVCGAGAPLFLLLIPESSLLIWLAGSVVTGTALMLLMTLVRVSLPIAGFGTFPALVVSVLIVNALAAGVLWRARLGRKLHLFMPVDRLVLVALIPIVASSLLVAARNGYNVGADGQEVFLARGFVNGDTATLFSLVRASEARGSSSELLRANPFAGNGPLEYPTLLHRALADLLREANLDVARVAWWLILPVLAGTVAISALSATIMFRGRFIPWWSFAVLLGAFGSTWESFTYPQSHTFLTGLFLLCATLLILSDRQMQRAERVVSALGAWICAALLLATNAVLGTAAVALVTVAWFVRAVARGPSGRERLWRFLGGGVLLLLFFRFPPGAGNIGTFNGAYTAIPVFLTAAVPAWLTLVAVIRTTWLHQSESLLLSSVVLPVLGVATLFGSGRDIVAENAPRFLFLSALIGWPLIVPLLQRAADWWWRETRHVTHSLAEQLALWSGAVVTTVFVLLPIMASVSGTLDNLVRKEPKMVSADELAAYRWIRSNTSPEAVFLRAPESKFERTDVAPLSLQAFTGRAQLRSEYWLSPADDLLERIGQVFQGGSVPAEAHYLFCGPEVRQCPDLGSLVYARGSATVRKMK